MTSSAEPRSVDGRTSARRSIYLAAALRCDGCSSPVRIKNIAATGALVEGGAVPSAGTVVQLVRGDLIVQCVVAWCANGRCGMKFSGSIDVQKWCAAPVNVEQQRADEIVALVKAGAVPLPVPALRSSDGCDEGSTAAPQLSRDLERVSGLLDSLGDALTGDPDLVSRYGTELQNLDIAVQVIATLQAALSGDGELRDGGGKLANLRRSADQVLQRAG